MKNWRIVVLVLLSVCLTSKMYAQGDVYFHFGPSIPVSDFGSDDVDVVDAGGAAVGLNVGLQYIYPLSESGLGLFGGVDFNYNGLKKDYKEGVDELYEDLGISNLEIIYYKYINVPITVGLNYSYQADDKIGVFANAGLALSFLKITDMEFKAIARFATLEMDLATNFGFKIGGGILINKKYAVSIDYLGLGKHDIDGQLKAIGYTEDIDGEIKVDFLTMTFGIKF